MKKILFGIMLVLLVNMVSGQTKIRISQIEDIQGTYIKSLGETSGKVLTATGSGEATWVNINVAGTLTNVAYKGSLTTNYLTKYNGTQLVNCLLFDNGTSVGIGTASPYGTFHINSSSLGTVQTIESTASAGYLIFREAGTLRGFIGYGDNGNLFTGATTNSMGLRSEADLHLGGSGNVLTMTLTGGNVGIGTTTPLAKLNVYDGISSKVIIGGNTVGNSAVIAAKYNAEGATGGGYGTYWSMDAYFDETTSTWLPLRTTLGKKYKIEQSFHKDGIIFSTAQAIQNPITWTDLLMIKGNTGNVLIGTTTDNGVDKLQVTGTASGTVDATLSNQFVRFGQLSGFITDGNTGWDNSYGFITDGNTGWDNSYGFITSYTETDPNVYAWAKAATKPTYTAGEVGAQPAATVLTNTTASFTTAQETKLSGIATGAEVNVNADWNSVSGDSQILNKPTIPTNTNQLTNGAGFITDGNTGWDNSYGFITSEVDGSISNEGTLGVGAGTSYTSLLSTNTSGANSVTFSAGSGMSISETVSGNGGEIIFTNNAPNITTDLSYSGSSSPVTLNSSDGTDVTFVAGTNILLSATGTALTIGLPSSITLSGTATSSNFILSSDRRLKERIRKIENLNWVDEIEFKNFEFKGDISDRLRYGVIAQELEKTNPELVFSDENGYKAVGYIDLLVAKVARQDEIIRNLIERINKLEDEKEKK